MNGSVGLNSTDAYLDWDYRIVSSIIFVPLSIVGISGNLMVILVVMTVRGMKTPTNCYLVSLACADCLFFVSTVPSELSSIHLPDNVFVFGRIGCSLLRFLPYLSINASSLSITAFTVERYIGICHPMKARYICTVKRAQYIIVTIWIFSILYNSTWLFLTDLKPLNYLDWPEAYQCTFSLSRESYKAIFLIDMFMFYWIPLLLYLILYGVMARTLVKAGVFDLQTSQTYKRPTANDGDIGHTREPIPAQAITKSRQIKSSQDTNGGPGPILSNTDSETSANGCVTSSGQRDPVAVIRKTSAPDTLKILVWKRTDSMGSSVSGRSMMDSSLDVHRKTTDTNSISNTRPSKARSTKACFGDSLNRSRAQVVKMLIVIVFTFALFCLPYRGLVVYNSFTRRPWVEKWYLLFAKTMVMANSAINPIMYNVMSGKFRNAFVLMFKRCFRLRQRAGLRDEYCGSVAPKYSLSTATIRQQTRYSATPRGSTCSRYSFSRTGNSVGALGSKRSASLGAADVNGRTTLVIPIIALTPDSAIHEMDESRVELLS